MTPGESLCQGVELKTKAQTARRAVMLGAQVTMDVTPSEGPRPADPPTPDEAGVSNPQLSLKEATLPTSRRHFFRNLACDGVTAVSTAYLARAAAACVKVSAPEVEGEQEAGPAPYPHTNTRTTFPSGLSFHNLGVQHTGLQFMMVRDTIERAIRSNDVVLLEGWAGQTYFDFVSAIAHQRGKVVLRLESGKSLFHDVGMSTSAVLAVYAAVGNIWHFLKRGFSALRDVASSIRNRGYGGGSADGDEDEFVEYNGPSSARTLFTVGVALNQYAFGFSESVRRFDLKTGEYPIEDSSYTMDGRTVLMLKDIEGCVTEFSNLRVLAITGDLHARGFSYYTGSPERYAVYQHRTTWYETLYRSWLGGKPKIEFDPALTGRETPHGT